LIDLLGSEPYLTNQRLVEMQLSRFGHISDLDVIGPRDREPADRDDSQSTLQFCAIGRATELRPRYCQQNDSMKELTGGPLPPGFFRFLKQAILCSFLVEL
jgi:hypothetical protein